MVFGPNFIRILYTVSGLISVVYTIHYGFGTNFQPNIIHYSFWNNFHPNIIHYGFWTNFHRNNILYGFCIKLIFMDFGLVFIS